MNELIVAIDEHIWKETTESKREISGGATFRASLLGACLRRQFMECVEGVGLPDVDPRTSRVFEVGHLTGEWLEAKLAKMKSDGADLDYLTEVGVYGAELDLGGHIDFLIRFGDRRYGVELKSKNSRAFWWAKQKSEPVAGENQLIQAGAYALLTDQGEHHCDAWGVLSVSKDDLMLAWTPVEQVHVEHAYERVMMLQEAKRTGIAPRCECFEMFNGKGWRYCAFGVSERECCGVKREGVA